jgi:two-component system sensor histidine kinase/response regulator
MSWTTRITDAQGKILTSNRAETPGQQAATSSPLLQPSLKPVTINGQRYNVQARPLPIPGLSAWCLAPQSDESGLITTRVVGATAVLLLGFGVIGALAQRARRIGELTAAQNDLQNMAHALPLTVFCYQQPFEGPGYFSFIGEGASKLLGLSNAELQGEPSLAWQLINPDQKQPPTQATEFPIEHHGRHLWLRCESHSTRFADGHQVFNGYWTDITERKQVDARWLAVFQHAPVAFIFYNIDQGIIRCNPRAVELFGGDNQHALMGLTPFKPPMSPSGQENLDALPTLQRIHQTSQASTLEWRLSRLNGDMFDAEIVLIPYEHDGKQHFCAIVQDITVRKQAEAALRNAQRASEAATQAKSRFLANMSHEIRTPMNAIMGMTHLALIDELPPKARNYVDKAHRAASSLLQILNDVLDVSKIEAGKLELEYADFQLESVISHMSDVLGMRAEEKSLELLFTAPPDIPTALIGDPIRLGQILINLGTNAIKFTQKGEILIGCDVQRLDPSDVVLHFWVRDSGIGMSPEQIERLFQPFTQGDNSNTRQYGGTGLGLTISRQLVEMMNGRIWVNSQVGKGSTVHFTARFGVQSQPNHRRALLANELQGKRVLLVDDNPTAREVLSDMTRRLGLHVDVSESGEQALIRMQQAAAEGKPHQVLLTDWKMPGMDGITFARQALSVQPDHRPCVLLVTAFAREDALKASEGIGLAGVINKPVTPSTLLDTLARVLGEDTSAPATPRSTSRVLQQAQRMLAGARVLLVEDQPMNQELACDLLERAGLSVATAANGQECLDKLASDGPFDGVLMDCQMPVMDGYTATERIRARPEWHSLPVIAMTASAMAADRERVLQCGMNDHITKPLDLGQMFTIMARWITPSKPAIAPKPMAPMPMSPTTLSNLDTADGLARCMGNMSLYQRLLKGFAKTQHDFSQQFANAADDEAALLIAHTLKGLAGNIGATRLLQAVTQLEASMQTKNADETQANLAITLDALQAVLADIDRLNRPKADVVEQQQASLDDSALHPQWAKLSLLIEDNDAYAKELLHDVLQAWPVLGQHPRVNELQRALERYDFEDAAKALSGVRSN